MKREEPPFHNFSFTKLLHIIVLEPLDNTISDEKGDFGQSFAFNGKGEEVNNTLRNYWPNCLQRFPTSQPGAYSAAGLGRTSRRRQREVA